MPVGEAAATAAATAIINAAAPSVMTRLGNRFSRSVDKLKVQFILTFREHLAASAFRARWVKTVASKDRPIDLETIYVPLILKNDQQEQFQDLTLDPTLVAGSRHIVSGTGGAGKTVLMKRLLLNALTNQKGLIPLFIELRNLGFDKKATLQQLVFENLAEDGGNETQSLFEAGLEEGLFVLFLDGFDEINPAYTDRAMKSLSVFGRKYRNCSVILSTRPGTGVHSLTDYSVYHLQPLTKDQAIALVEKTKFETISKSKFLTALKGGLYEKHQSMMSIPILIVMMLLTFRSYGEIPDRMTVFYSQAFDTLYSIHDAEGKESYKRIHDSGLPPDIFRHVLNCFCYLSLCNYDIEFSKEELENYVGKAIAIARAECAPTDYISDLVKNVCILQPDGLSYLFVHRSFQEFFAATFASRYSGKKPFTVYDQIIRISGPDLHRMLLEIDRAKLFRQWLHPKLDSYADKLRKVANKTPREKWDFFMSKLLVMSADLSVMIGPGRKNELMDGQTLSTILGFELTPVDVIRRLEFKGATKKNIVAKISSLPRRKIQHPTREDAFIELDNQIVDMSSDATQAIATSNFASLFDGHVREVEKKLKEVKATVESDVLVEDLIFDD